MCEGVVAKIQYHKLETRNMPRFFQHGEILPKLHLLLFMLDSFYCQAYILCISKYIYDFHKYNRFFPQFYNIKKTLCKRATTKEMVLFPQLVDLTS